jgi:ParB family chromosome partitioning protein
MRPISKVQTVKIADIQVSENRIRQIDASFVEALSISIEDIGQTTAITVQQTEDGTLHLVSGLHRIHALLLLGRTTVEAIVMKISNRAARLLEIEENMMRRELSILSRAICLEERKALYEEEYKETRWGGDRKSDQVPMIRTRSASFAVSAADMMGVSRSTISDWVQLAAALSPDARRLLEGTSIADNRKELRWIGTKIDRDEQAAAIQAAFDAGKLPSEMDADAKADAPAQPQPLIESRTLFIRFEKISSKGREQFLSDLIRLGWIKKGSIIPRDER